MADFNYNSNSIGTGSLFPIKLTENEDGTMGWYPVTGDISLIENNLRTLIDYSLGQRIRQEDYGTRLWECIEEPDTKALRYMISKFLTDSIYRYEPRIIINKIDTNTLGMGKVQIILEYSVIGTDNYNYMEITYNN